MTSTTPTLSWQASSGASSYDIRIYEGSCDPSAPIGYAVNDVTGTSFTVPANNLKPGKTYSWFVSAKNSSTYIFSNVCAQSYNGACWTFTTPPPPPVPPSCFNLASPSNGATVTTTPTLSWQASPGASSYDIRVYEGSCDPSSPIGYAVNDVTGTSFTVPAGNLKLGKTYSWFVSAKNSSTYIFSNVCAQSYNGACWTFTTTQVCGPLSGAVFLAFSSASNSCTENGGTCGLGETITFNVAPFGYDFACATHTFSWNFGDGTSATGRTVTHAYSAGGPYYVSCAISNGREIYVATTTVKVGPVPTPCIADSNTACLLNGRFRARLRYRGSFDNSAADTDAFVKQVSGFANGNYETAFFYFNSSNNIEILLKMLDQGNSNSIGQPTIAVLFGSATPLRVELAITDMQTGTVKRYASQFSSQAGSSDFTAFVK